MTDTDRMLPLLAKVLQNTVKLPGSACRDHPALFEPQHADEARYDTVRRHEAAARMCLFACPAYGACSQWVESLAPRQRPAGVVAGIRPALSAASGRPRKEPAA